MGILADGVLDSGGLVIGVEPQMFIDQDVQHNGLTKLIVTKDIPERRTKMIELGDAFIAFPGGTGTLEEISEVMSLIALNRIDSPCIIYNLNGYYDGLKELLDTMVKFGFSSDERQSKIHIVNNISEIDVKNLSALALVI